ncbi:MAG: tetratricopeptide repeat protein [Candidatus Melainabacteria bacterium]|nr:tetratricopeptide repeat protein [Candidatus Melainabacteria bacterium]
MPPKKIPRHQSADEYFCLAIQYIMLCRLGLALKATTRAIAGHSQLGRQFVTLWSSQSGNPIATLKLNKGQYFLMYLGFVVVEALVSTLVPVVKSLWSMASSAPVNVISWIFSKHGKENTTDSSSTDLSLLPSAIARTVVPEGLTAEAYLELGKKYKQNGWIGQSQQALKFAENLAPADSSIAIASHTYLQTKVPHAQVSLEVEMENIAGYHAMSQGDLPKCKKIFEKLMKEHPDFEWPYLNLANAYCRDLQLTEAKFLLRKLLSINPVHVEAWYALARIHAGTFELEEAKETLAQARSLYTDSDDASLGTMIDCLLLLEDETKPNKMAA